MSGRPATARGPRVRGGQTTPTAVGQRARSYWSADPALCGDVATQLVQPGRGLGIAGRTPIPTRRERPSRADLRPVRQGRPFELAQLEEAQHEDLQPRLDRGQVVVAPLPGRKPLRPHPARLVVPGVVAQVRDLAGTVAIARDVEEVEIL